MSFTTSVSFWALQTDSFDWVRDSLVLFCLKQRGYSRMQELEFGSGEADGDNGTAYQQRCCSSFYLSCRQFVLLLAKNFLLQVCIAYAHLSLSLSLSELLWLCPWQRKRYPSPFFVFQFRRPISTAYELLIAPLSIVVLVFLRWVQTRRERSGKGQKFEGNG